MVQLVESPSFDLGSGLDLKVVSLSSVLGSVLGKEPYGTGTPLLDKYISKRRESRD